MIVELGVVAPPHALSKKTQSNSPLSDEVNGTYDGPLSKVIGLLLPGRNFVLKHEERGLRLVIVSTVGLTIPVDAPRVPAPAPKAKPSSSKAQREEVGIKVIRRDSRAGEAGASETPSSTSRIGSGMKASIAVSNS